MPNNKLKIWCLERTDVPKESKPDVMYFNPAPLKAYWATDHWIWETTKGCTLMTKRAATVLLTDYKLDKTDKRTYRIRRV